MARTPARNGNSCTARRAISASAAGSGAAENPAASRLDPIRTVPLAVPSTTAEHCSAAESLSTALT